MEVALVLGGASVAGALLGAVAALTKAGRSSEQALVPWTGDERKRPRSSEQALMPSKVRRLSSSLSPQEQDAYQDSAHAITDAEFGHIVALAGTPQSQTGGGWCATQALLDSELSAREAMHAHQKRIEQDLALIHAALHQSLAALRGGSPDIPRHVSMLTLLGKRIMLEPALLDALPVAAETMRHYSRMEHSRRRFADEVLGALERGLLQRAEGLESRLRTLASEASSSSAASSAQLQVMPAAMSAVKTLHLANQASATLQDAPSKGAASSVTRFHAFWEEEQPVEDEEPMEEALWKALQSERSVRKETPFIPLPPSPVAASNAANPTPPSLAAGSRAVAGPDEPKDPSELALLAVLGNGTEDDLRIIKGMRPTDVKKLLAHRRKHGRVGRLEELPKILGRKISLAKLLKDNAV